MKIEKTTVLEYLKPKVKALGFKKDEVESIAADIADNLDEVADDASEEDINAVIKPAVDAVIPSLKIAQKIANRAIEDYRKKHEKDNEQKPEQKHEEKPEQKSEEKPSIETPKKEEKNDETPEWAKSLIESNKQQAELIKTMQAELSGIKTKSTAEKRRQVLDELLKDTGTFGKRTLKSFEKMNFETDEDFESFVSEIKEDIEQLNQERADAGLAKLGNPAVTKPDQEPEKPKVLTETQIAELADSM